MTKQNCDCCGKPKQENCQNCQNPFFLKKNGGKLAKKYCKPCRKKIKKKNKKEKKCECCGKQFLAKKHSNKHKHHHTNHSDDYSLDSDCSITEYIHKDEYDCVHNHGEHKYDNVNQQEDAPINEQEYDPINEQEDDHADDHDHNDHADEQEEHVDDHDQTGLHAVIAIDTALRDANGHPFKVDHDNGGTETFVFKADESHNHDFGKDISAYEWWDESHNLISEGIETAPITYSVGNHTIILNTYDTSVPPKKLSLTQKFSLVSPEAVPGISVKYYKDQLDNSLMTGDIFTKPDFVHSAYGVHLEEKDFKIGDSNFTENTLVRYCGNLCVNDAVGDDFSYALTASNGYELTIYIDGVLYDGGNLTSKKAVVDYRVLIKEDLSSLPFGIEIMASGSTSFMDSLAPGEQIIYYEHSQLDMTPVVNEVVSAGKINPGNVIQISGQGFYSSDPVQVFWNNYMITDPMVTPNLLEFTVPTIPDDIENGPIVVYVAVDGRTSNLLEFKYDFNVVPVKFILSKHAVGLPCVTSMIGPDERLYIGSVTGDIFALTFDDNYDVTDTQQIETVKGLSNSNILGLTFNPYDGHNPVKIYVSHSQLYANGGAAIPDGETSPYSGGVSVLTGPDFDVAVPLVTGLPVSNHDHGINGLEFTNNGDLMICVGGNTNAGVKADKLGDLDESPLSASILIAETSKRDFNGAITYVNTSDGQPNDDQLFGGSVDVAPGSDVRVYAPGFRNCYDIALTVDGNLYCTDNGPNNAFGPASTGPDTQGPGIPDEPYEPDKLCHVFEGKYYGHPNRNRGRTDSRQNIYYTHSSSSVEGVFEAKLAELPSSTNGLIEYRSHALDGQMYGELLAQKFRGKTSRIKLSEDKNSVSLVVDPEDLKDFTCLDVTMAPGGVVLGMSYVGADVKIAKPVDTTPVTKVFDVFPYRAPKQGGRPFVISGQKFGNFASTKVFFGDVEAELTSVTSTRIRGLVPSYHTLDTVLVDVKVVTNGVTVVHHDMFRYLVDSTGKWYPVEATGLHATMKRHESSFVECGGKMYLLGGRGIKPVFEFTPDSVDPTKGVWVQKGTIPIEMHHTQAVCYEGIIYIVNGMTDSYPNEVPLEHIQMYDPSNDTWAEGPEIPLERRRGSSGTVVYNGRIYTVGGIQHGHTSGHVAWFDQFDPVTGVWVELLDAPRTRDHVSAVVVEDKLYLAGGRRSDSATDVFANTVGEVDVYDFVSGVWSTLANDLPSRRAGASVVALVDELLVIGGESDAQVEAFDKVEAMNLTHNSWRELSPMNLGRHGTGTILHNGLVYVVAGSKNRGNDEIAHSDPNFMEVLQWN